MDSDGYLYVSDHNRHEMKPWKIGETNGIVVAGGNGQGSRLSQLSNPMHIFVDQDRSVYVSDYSNHRVMKWIEGARESVVVVVGGNGGGAQSNQFNSCGDLSFDRHGNLYVADANNNRIQKFKIDPTSFQ